MGDNCGIEDDVRVALIRVGVVNVSCSVSCTTARSSRPRKRHHPHPKKACGSKNAPAIYSTLKAHPLHGQASLPPSSAALRPYTLRQPLQPLTVCVESRSLTDAIVQCTHAVLRHGRTAAGPYQASADLAAATPAPGIGGM